MGRPIAADGDTTNKAGALERFPSFPGGEKALFRYLDKEKRMPKAARDLKVSGPVTVTFLIDSLGVVHDPQVVRGIGFGCDEEAVRLVQAMPRWTPALRDGRPVKCRYSLPVKFP